MLLNAIVILVLKMQPAQPILMSALALIVATGSALMVKTRSNALAPMGGKETAIANQTLMIVQE